MGRGAAGEEVLTPPPAPRPGDDGAQISPHYEQFRARVLTGEDAPKSATENPLNFGAIEQPSPEAKVVETSPGHAERPVTPKDADTWRSPSFLMREEKQERFERMFSCCIAISENTRSFMVFTEDNFLRKGCIWLADYKWFNRAVLLCILANCVTLGLYDPLNPDKEWLDVVESFFLVAFTVELVVKAIAWGLVFGEETYLRNPWNCLDFFVVATAYLSLVGGGNLGALRALRGLRPLRTVSVVPGLKMLVSALLESIPLMLDVLALMTFFFMVFGIIAIGLWKGVLDGRCHAPDVNGTMAVVEGLENAPCGLEGNGGNWECDPGQVCIDTGIPPNYGYTSFDNILWAFLQLQQTVLMQSWNGVIAYPLMDAVGTPALLWFIFVILLGSLFVLQLVVAVIASKFSQLAEENRAEDRRIARNKAALVLRGLEEERDPPKWYERAYTSAKGWWIFKSNPLESTEPLRKMIETNWFNNVVLFVIVVNTVCMATRHYGMSTKLEDVLEGFNYFFLGFFCLEFAVKHLALGFVGYWRDSWNILDGLIVIFGIVESVGSGANLSAIRVLRVFRVLRTVKVMKESKAMRKLLHCMVRGFLGLREFSLLLALFIFIFCIVGMQTFGGEPEFRGQRRTFDTFWQSVLTLFEMLTGNSFFEVMWACMRAKGNASVAFTVVWMVVGNLTLLTLFLAILIEEFKEASDNLEKLAMEEAAKLLAEEDQPQTSQRRKQRRLERRQRRFARENRKLKAWLIDLGEWSDPDAEEGADAEVDIGDEVSEDTDSDEERNEEAATPKPPSKAAPEANGSAEDGDDDETHMMTPGKAGGGAVKLEGASPGPGSREGGAGGKGPVMEDTSTAPPLSSRGSTPRDVSMIAHGVDGGGMAMVPPVPMPPPREAGKGGGGGGGGGGGSIGSARSSVYSDHMEEQLPGTPSQSQENSPTGGPPSSARGGGGAGGRGGGGGAAPHGSGIPRPPAAPRPAGVPLLAPHRAHADPSNSSPAGRPLPPGSQSDRGPARARGPGAVVESSSAAASPASGPLAPPSLGAAAEMGGEGYPHNRAEGAQGEITEVEEECGGAGAHGWEGRGGSEGEGELAWRPSPRWLEQSVAGSGLGRGLGGGRGPGGRTPMHPGHTPLRHLGARGGRPPLPAHPSSSAAAAAGPVAEAVEAGSVSNEAASAKPNGSAAGGGGGGGGDPSLSIAASMKMPGVAPTGVGGGAPPRRPESPESDDGSEADTEISEYVDENSVPLPEREFMQARSLYLFGPYDPKDPERSEKTFRFKLGLVALNKYFDNTILTLIMISSVLLALETPTWPKAGSTVEDVFKILDLIFTVAFTIEAVVKITVMGFFQHPGAYLRSKWNSFDFLIVVTSLIAVTMDNDDLAPIRLLRLLRTLRPLRMVSRFQGLKIVVEAVIAAVPSVLHVVMVGILMFLIFAIMGYQLFGGLLYRCNDDSVEGKFDCVGQYDAGGGQMVERAWRNADFNFDNVLQGYVALFALATGDSWTDVTFQCMDIVGEDKQPRFNHSPHAAIFFVVFVFLGFFFWINLLVSVMVDFYSNAANSVNLSTEAQRNWSSAFALTAEAQDRKWRSKLPENKFRRAIFRVVVHDVFEPAMIGAIVLNVIMMATEHKDQGKTWDDVLYICNVTFTVIYSIEALMKLVTMYWSRYWSSWWNRFDFVIVIISIVDLCYSFGGFAAAFRVARIGRMFKIVKSAKGLRALFNTFIQSLPAILNVGGLLMLLMFVYAVLGMNLFGDLEVNVPTPTSGAGLVRYQNFENFPNALSALFQAFTGNWVYMLTATFIDCGGSEGFFGGWTCSNKVAPPLFFASYNLVATYMMLNLLVAVVMEKFFDSATAEGLLGVSQMFETVRRKMLLDRFAAALAGKVRMYHASDAYKNSARFQRRSSNLGASTKNTFNMGGSIGGSSKAVDAPASPLGVDMATPPKPIVDILVSPSSPQGPAGASNRILPVLNTP